MRAAELVVACFLLFGACLVWPLLAIANRPVLVLGVPPFVVYLFAVWAAMVVVQLLLARRFRSPEDEP
jgi:membrane protein implicated in regulation of membrane protease activity